MTKKIEKVDHPKHNDLYHVEVEGFGSVGVHAKNEQEAQKLAEEAAGQYKKDFGLDGDKSKSDEAKKKE